MPKKNDGIVPGAVAQRDLFTEKIIGTTLSRLAPHDVKIDKTRPQTKYVVWGLKLHISQLARHIVGRLLRV
jgi:hypothetical protein